jgi:hypothetical protein
VGGRDLLELAEYHGAHLTQSSSLPIGVRLTDIANKFYPNAASFHCRRHTIAPQFGIASDH